MKKLVVIGAMALAALGAAVGIAPSASAYPELSCNVTVDAQKVSSGSELNVTATSQQVSSPRLSAGRAAAAAVDWRAEFNGHVRTAHADVLHTSFTIPTVKAEKVLVLHVRALMADGTTTCEKSLDITVSPGSTTVSPPGGHLPNTGGPRLILLIGGLVLVLAGGVAVRQSRKGHDAHQH